MKTLFKFTLILIIFGIFLYAFSASFTSHSLENLAYVIGIGIDNNNGNSKKLKVSFQFIQLATLGDVTSGETPTVLVNSVVSDSIEDAINLMNTYIGKELNLAHCNVIVFSKELAETGISTEIYSLMNNEDVRPSTNLIISTSTAYSFLENVKPNLEKLVTKYYDTFSLTSNFTGQTQDITIGTFYNRLLSDKWDNTITLAEVFKSQGSDSGSSSQSQNSDSNSSSQSQNSGNESESNKNENSSNENNSTQSTGDNSSSSSDIGNSSNQFDISGKRGTENSGIAIFKNDKLIGTLSGSETIWHLLLSNDVIRFMLSIPNIDQDILNLVLYISPKTPPKISVDTSSDNPTINIDLFLEAEILTLDNSSHYNSSYNLENVSEKAQAYINENINNYLYKVSKEFNADIDGFARFAVRHFLTESDWYSYDWDSKYKNANFNVNTTLNVASSLLITEVH